MKQELLIFGGSNFVNTIDKSRINLDRFDILAINRPPLDIPTHYLVAHDTDFRQCYSQEEVKQILTKGLNPVFTAPKTEFIHETTGWKWKFDYINHNIEEKCLGFCLYTCSSAVNFAYLKGYKNIYFIGVDLEEDNKPFTHWHGVTNHTPVSSVCARQCKNYMYQYKKWLNIYQCNPTVSKDWQCDYYPVEKLYSHQQ